MENKKQKNIDGSNMLLKNDCWGDYIIYENVMYDPYGLISK